MSVLAENLIQCGSDGKKNASCGCCPVHLLLRPAVSSFLTVARSRGSRPKSSRCPTLRLSFPLHLHSSCSHTLLRCPHLFLLSVIRAFSFLILEHASQVSVGLGLFLDFFCLGLFCSRSWPLSRSRSPFPRIQEEAPSPARHPRRCG